ncbi:NTP transferase domain-containing protein [Streptosporangium jomthongense]|uniref:NTP transferase domain-containing protein n=1 Tax=Streptosporangium jomthongense TaxID=1193683 RepID=A0ABV8FGM0_9ACTN
MTPHHEIVKAYGTRHATEVKAVGSVRPGDRVACSQALLGETLPRSTTHWYTSVSVHPEPPPVLVLAGGQGLRLRAAQDDPELADTPKLLVRLASGQPMLGQALTDLARSGLRRICLLTGAPETGGDLIRRYVHAHTGEISLRILRERQPLGTAGAVYAALGHLHDEVVAVAPADTLFPFEQLPAIITRHREAGHLLTWAVTSRPGPAAQNIGRLRARDGLLIHADESGTAPECAAGEPVTGVGVMVINTAGYRRAFTAYVRTLPAPGPVDLYRDVVPWLLATGHCVAVADIACPAPDLGTPERLRAFGRTAFRPSAFGASAADA